jgi:hypothetical protein
MIGNQRAVVMSPKMRLKVDFPQITVSKDDLHVVG